MPAIAEFVHGFDVTAWHGVMAPAGTPERIVQKLNEEIVAFLRQPATEAKLRERGVIRGGNSAREFRTLIANDLELYRSVIRQAGIKPE